MGKSGGRKKKGGASNQQQEAAPNGTTTVHLDPSISLKRAHELKEEGNKRFQTKDFAGALDHYDSALKLIPSDHLDGAVFHSNRAACLMQMKPVDYEAVIHECSMAIQVQPRFVRALLRRARAYEAVGKNELAMQDLMVLLNAEPIHRDALEIAQRVRVARDPPQDLQSRPSPAALGASAVRGAPVGGLGPCFPARPPVPKKGASSISPAGSVLPSVNKPEKQHPVSPAENGPADAAKTQFPKLVLKPSNGSSRSSSNPSKGSAKEVLSSLSAPLPAHGQRAEAAIRWRQLKLVYDHDIRLSQIPVSCNFRVLRETVTKRFPSSKSVLIKYKDNDGDLVTITSTAELRLGESCVDKVTTEDPEDKAEAIGMLRLHIVEVSPEQEPALLEEEEEKPVESELTKEDESGSHSSLGESVLDVADDEIDKTEKEAAKEKPGAGKDPECKELEMDDWLFEFSQLFRSHVGIDPDVHIDLHELGMELCSEALEEAVTSEEAQVLFDKAATKFQEVAALAFFNWGNVYMCAARKRIPLDESAGKDVVAKQLQIAYDWVKDKYSLAREKYKEALAIKPDFYEGLLALGQQQFEMAKLHWSFALAKKIDLSTCDSTEMLKLFNSAEEKMKVATDMWEKLEEQRAKELEDPTTNKKEEMLKRKKKQGSGNEGAKSGAAELSADEAAEQAAVMRSQIHLFWGNMLFERSQVECKLGLDGWEKNMDDAVDRFKLAGASEADIAMVLKNHCSKVDVVEEGEKTVQDLASNVSAEATGDSEIVAEK